jgi:hypothetical protein
VGIIELDNDPASLRVDVDKENVISFQMPGGKEVNKIDCYVQPPPKTVPFGGVPLPGAPHYEVVVEPTSSVTGAALAPAGNALVVFGTTTPGTDWPPRRNSSQGRPVHWMQVWVADGGSLKPLPVRELDNGAGSAGTFSPDGTLLAMVSGNQPELWQVRPEGINGLGTLPALKAKNFAFSADNRRLALMSLEQTIVYDRDPVVRPAGGGERFRQNLLWALLLFGVTGSLFGKLVFVGPPPRWARRFAVAAAVSGFGGLVCLIWWSCLAFFEGPTVQPPPNSPLAKSGKKAVAFSPDGRSLAAVLLSGDLVAFDLETGAETGRWSMPEEVTRAEYAPDGRHLLAIADRKAYVLRLRTFDEAGYILACCEAQLKDDPGSVDALVARGLAYREKGDLPRAITGFSEAIDRDGSNASAYYQRGLTRADFGDLAGARADLAKAVRLDPLLDPDAKPAAAPKGNGK